MRSIAALERKGYCSHCVHKAVLGLQGEGCKMRDDFSNSDWLPGNSTLITVCWEVIIVFLVMNKFIVYQVTITTSLGSNLL